MTALVRTCLITGARLRARGGVPASTLLVRHGRIVAVGDDSLAADVLDAEPSTRRIDVGGRVVTPGFVDAHVHPVLGQLQATGPTVTPDSSIEECWNVVRETAKRGGSTDWIVVAGYSAIRFSTRGITRHDLDAVESARPVVMVNSDVHGGLANSAALRASGLLGSDSTFLERDADGEPTGLVNEGALDVLLNAVPPPTADAQRHALLEAQSMLHALGIVGWQDAFLGEQRGHADATAQYRKLATEGLLTARVSGALGWDATAGLEQIEPLVARRADAPAGRFHAPAVKIFVDGVHESGTAAMRADYFDASGNPLGHNGHSAIDPDVLREVVQALDALDFDIHLHALGDRAVSDGLDAIAHARRTNGHRGTRHQIAHVTFLEHGDAERFARLDVTLNLQAVWTATDFLDFEQYRRYVGPEPMTRMSRLADWKRAGARFAMGSDWPVSTADPLAAIHAAAHRALQGDSASQFDGQVLALDEAWDAYTAGSAWSSRLDGTGALDVGSHADFVVWDGDPFASSSASSDARVAQTWIDGELVHDSYS